MIKNAGDARALVMKARDKMLREADIEPILLKIESVAASGYSHCVFPTAEMNEGCALKLEGLGFEVEEEAGGWLVQW